ncbi:MAG: glucose-6-phosphate dehydrogenase, partial [Candidatus Colwellbacteria bacterium]|nr:glucose-6-phosphate dehydrogenase [Candidatus Colwellbacteria bacterium]
MPQASKDIPTILVVLGATGDLMARKITPALFDLFSKGQLPDMFQVIGFARRDLTNGQLQNRIKKNVLEHTEVKPNEKKLKEFLKLFSYHRGQFQTREPYFELLKKLEEIDSKWGVCSNKLFYLAVPPELYKVILTRLASSGLTDPCGPDEGWTRVLIEKPFGKDYKTAEDLNQLLSRLFKEIQIYRIDHYLAKEMLQNILTFRFSNNLFEQI